MQIPSITVPDLSLPPIQPTMKLNMTQLQFAVVVPSCKTVLFIAAYIERAWEYRENYAKGADIIDITDGTIVGQRAR